MSYDNSQRTREQWQGILRAGGIRPQRSMGQNFLVVPEVVEEIVRIADVDASDIVLEVGPGLGMLTRELARTGACVVAIELDRDLKRFLESDLASFGNVRVVERDALHVDVEGLVDGTPYKLVANLPYSTGTAIARRFLEHPTPPESMTVMLQREVAERMVAEPPDMSLLTLSSCIHAVGEIAMYVPPDAFYPPPKVESAVVHLRVRNVPLVDEDEEAALFRLATVAFQRKRKTLSNGLAQGLGRSKGEIDAVLQSTGIDPSRRPQTLTVDEWIALTRIIGS
jgi:16S rRNA (adenine1518-N6/adenine1519-N6)-dimethyltransferase